MTPEDKIRVAELQDERDENIAMCLAFTEAAKEKAVAAGKNQEDINAILMPKPKLRLVTDDD